MTNKEIVRILRHVAAAYTVKDENRFKIIAYGKAADSIENLPTEVKDLWKEGKLAEIVGVGPGIQSHLDELFRTGKVKHFESVMKGLPGGMFPLLELPGFGPKRAYLLAKTFKLTDPKTAITKLTEAAKKGKIATLESFGEKSQEEILKRLISHEKDKNVATRMRIDYADEISSEVKAYLLQHRSVARVDVLGSLRRRVPTIGDMDLAVATNKPQSVVEYFLAFPKIKKVIEKGPSGASATLSNARQVDLRVQAPNKYGAMLQYFTGSKNHNIKLRELALSRNMSLNEYGIRFKKKGTWGEVVPYGTEEALYKVLGLPLIPPEIREDRGEIEAALRQARGKLPGLPTLIKLSDIKGDLHIHSNYNLEPSHDLGSDSIENILSVAQNKKYEYVGISDHNPSISMHTKNTIIDIMKRRYEYFEKIKYSNTKNRVQILIMMEIDILPDGKLALPDEAFDYIDAAIVSIHSSFTQPRDSMTKRILTGLSHPKVKILGHPTGRLIEKREGVSADWEKIFDYCKTHHKALEINASPHRLDLPDALVFEAVNKGISLVIDTDSHAVGSMDMMRFGIDVARRGWAEKKNIRNTLGYNEVARWLKN